MSDHNFSPCVVIPVYNHAYLVPRVLEQLAQYKLPCIMVNDGSDVDSSAYLRQLAQNEPGLILEEQFPNQGKGAAVMRGLRSAYRLGYSHAVQIDADGQHCVEDLPKLLDAARRQPHALVTGVPLYDQSVPRSRLLGRYLTHFWVWIETLSLTIKDSMCGFRVYPLSSTLALAEKVAMGNYMDFDTHVMVRLYWEGAPVISIPTAVKYPEDGISNFHLWRDNLRITWMHTRLVLGMLPRIPLLLRRNWSGYYRIHSDSR